MQYYLAIDIGASSGRHVLGYVQNGKFTVEEIHRFENRQVRKNGHDCWDVENLRNGIIDGLKACKTAGKIPVSLSIDTWGVDFFLLDKDGNEVGDAVAYRDDRTEGMDKVVEESISFQDLYTLTGIAKAPYNTIYQLTALKREHPEQLEQADCLLMSPNYYLYLLTGKKVNEYTIASTSGMLNAKDKVWDEALLDTLGLKKSLFLQPQMPGTVVGNLRPEIRDEVGFDTTVILAACHDTGSAFLTIPAKDDNAVYISSGTWSLLGVENEVPITTEEAQKEGFTNEGGAWGRYRFLKNIMGLWIIQSIRRELNGTDYVQKGEARKKAEKQWSFPDLIREAESAEDFPSVIDVNKDRFLSPDSMIEEIKTECRETGQPVPETIGELLQCAYKSLVQCYCKAIEGLQVLTGKTYTSINIVGGGCQDMYLNRLTAKATGRTVYAGPVEGTAIGNILVQMVAQGELKNLQHARDLVRDSFEIKTIPAE
ncbi:MAG: rhamnulokinase [Oscillospiraceae bacterium]|nr:rhamnulokinase [Oscillospiraceae bacterium]